MVEEDKRYNQSLIQKEERPLVELPALLLIGIVFFSFLLGISLLILPWYLVVLLFLGLALVVAIGLNPFISIPLYLIGAYLRPMAFVPELVRFQLPVIAAVFVVLTWIFHIIIYRDFRPVRTKQWIALGGFSIVLLGSSVFHWDTSYFSFLDIVKMLILYFLVANLVKTKEQVKVIVFFLLLLGLITSIYAGYQQAHGLGERLGGGVVRVTGFEGDPNYLALDIVLLIPFVLGLFINSRSVILRGILFVLLILFAFTVVITFSRAGFLGMILVLVLGLWKFTGIDKRFAQVIIIGIIILILIPFVPLEYLERVKSIVNLEEVSIRGRLDGMIVGFWIMKDHPFLGIGLDRWVWGYLERAITSPYVQTKFSWFPHNVFVEVGSQLGALGLLFFLFLIAYIFKDLRIAEHNFFKKKRSFLLFMTKALRMSMTGFLVSALFVAAIHLKLFWILGGFSIALKQLSMTIDMEDET